MEVLKLEVKLELQLPAYTTATATAPPDPSHVCNLQMLPYQILNPLSEARDGMRNLVVPSWFHFRCATMGIPV